MANLWQFPRVIVELDPYCLSVTRECRQAATAAAGNEKAVQQFYETYGETDNSDPWLYMSFVVSVFLTLWFGTGNAFVTRFSLGGYLKSTRHLTQIERKSLGQAKEKARLAAGLSFQSPKGGGNLNYASVTEKGNEKGEASLFQSLQLAWEARGGNTLLCSK